MDSAEDLAWASNLLGLELHRLDQLQSGAVYLLILEAFHPNCIPLGKVSLGSRYEYEFVHNYRVLKSAFERLNVIKFVDRQRLMSSAEPHEALLRWFHNRYADIPVRSSYDPMKQRRATQGGDIKAIPVPVKTGKISTPMADIGGRAIKPSGIPKVTKVPRLELRKAAATKAGSPPRNSKKPSPPRPLKAASPPKASSPPKAASPPKSARGGFRLAALSAAAASRAGLKTPRLLLARTPRSPTGPLSARRTSPKTSPTRGTKRGSPGRRVSISVDASRGAKPSGVVFKVSPNSGLTQRTPRLFPAQLPTPRQLSSAFRTPRGSGGVPATPRGPMSESKAGFSHGAIPRNALMQPRSVGGSSAVPRLRCPSSAAQGTENQSLIANQPAQVPKLSWIQKAAQKLSHTVAKTPRTAALTAGKAETPPRRLLHVSPKRPPADTDAEQQCPRPPVDSHPLADIATPADISPVVSSLRDDVSEPSPAVLRLRALRQRAVSPETARKRRSALRCAAPDSATSLNSARGARAKDPAARRRNSLAGMELGAILLSPDKAACLASASCKIETADGIAQAAATTVLRAIPELQLLLKDIGSSNRDGYLHRGKLRCRRWMVGAMIPRTRELLMHVRQLSQLAIDDPGARARVRRAKRLLKELSAAEQSFADVCDQIAKAERFFPVPGIGHGEQTARESPADSKAGARQLEVSLRAVGQAMLDLQQLWVELAPHSPWAATAKAARQSPGARLPDARSGVRFSLASDITGDVSGEDDDLSDDDACSNASDDRPLADSTSGVLKSAKILAESPTQHSDENAGPAAERIRTKPIVTLDLGSVQAGSSSSSEDGAESPESMLVQDFAGTLPHEAATPTKPAIAAVPQPSPCPQARAQHDVTAVQEMTEEMATPPRCARAGPQDTTAASAACAPFGSAGSAADVAAEPMRQPEPAGRKPTRIPEWSPCSTLSSSGSSSAAYSGNLKPPGSRAGSPSTVLRTPEAALRSAKSGAASVDRARRRGVNAELARFFGCGPLSQPPTIRNKPAASAASNPASPSSTDEAGMALPVRKVTFPSGHKYFGQINNGTMHGLGVYAFDSTQARYEGEFLDGAFEGLGAETFADGMYVGSFRNGLRHGLGVCHYRNGDYYEGGWRAGLRHGWGMQQCTDGSNYVGAYCAGQRRGCGIYSFPNGDRYEGECAADAPNGHGVYRFAASGAVLEGTWEAGAKHGWAVVTVGSQQSYGRWEAGTLISLAPLEPDAALEDGEEAELEDDEAEARDVAAETARTARAAGLRAIRIADDHWRAAGPMQMELQELLQRAQAAARTARQLAKPLMN